MSLDSAVVSVRDVPTRVLHLGPGPEDREHLRGGEVVLVIPGNPGLAGYYEQFMLDLREELAEAVGPDGCPTSIWAVSHAGHEIVQHRGKGLSVRSSDADWQQQQKQHYSTNICSNKYLLYIPTTRT